MKTIRSTLSGKRDNVLACKAMTVQTTSGADREEGKKTEQHQTTVQRPTITKTKSSQKTASMISGSRCMSADPLAVIAANKIAALCQLTVGSEEPDFEMGGDVLMKSHHASALMVMTTSDDVDVAALRQWHGFADSHCHRLPPPGLPAIVRKDHGS